MARVNHRQGVFAYRVILHVRAVKPCLIFHRQGAGEARYAMCRRLFRSAKYRELSFLLRAVKLATFIKNRWHLGGSWSFCNLLSFTPLSPSFFLTTFVNICRLRSGWGPICAVCCVHGALGRTKTPSHDHFI